MKKATRIRWDPEALVEMRPGVWGATVESEQLTITLYKYEPGSSWESHSHPEDQVTIVVEGGPIHFESGGECIPMSEGESVLIPGGTTHAATLGDTATVTLNIFPPRAQRR
jgi:quercetin dioxygenase-like cupin family protein